MDIEIVKKCIYGKALYCICVCVPERELPASLEMRQGQLQLWILIKQAKRRIDTGLSNFPS